MAAVIFSGCSVNNMSTEMLMIEAFGFVSLTHILKQWVTYKNEDTSASS